MGLNIHKDAFIPLEGTCIAPDCNDIWAVLQESRANLSLSSDNCYEWSRFVCGHHFARRQGDVHPVAVIEDVVQKLFETVHSMIDPLYEGEASSPGDGNTSSTSSTTNYSTQDVAMLESLFSTETSAGESASQTIPPHGQETFASRQDDNPTGLAPNPPRAMASKTLVVTDPTAPRDSSHDSTPVPGTATAICPIRPWATANPFGNTTFNVTLPPPPSQPPDGTADLWAMAQGYFNACMSAKDSDTSYSVLLELMEEVRRPFHGLDDMSVFTHSDQQDTWRRVVNSSEPLADADAYRAMKAMLNLAPYGIFPLFKFGVGASYPEPSQIKAIIAPHHRTGLNNPALYKLPSILQHYEQMLEMILPKLHGPHARTVQEMHKLPMNIIELEQALHEILPSDKQWRDMKNNVKNVTLAKFSKPSPFRFDELLPALAHSKSDVEVVDAIFLETIQYYWPVIQDFSKETLRTYMMWQVFLQTEELWDMPWAKDWRAFTQVHSPAVRPSPRRDETCVDRVQRHFNHLINARLMEGVFAQKDWKDPVFTVADVVARLGHPEGDLMQIYKDARVYVGTAGTAGTADTAPGQDEPHAPVSKLVRPEKWSHLHDWFALEKMHWTRSWMDIGYPPEKNKCLNLGMSFKVAI